MAICDFLVTELDYRTQRAPYDQRLTPRPLVQQVQCGCDSGMSNFQLPSPFALLYLLGLQSSRPS